MTRLAGVCPLSEVWFAATINVYGGGVAEDDFLRALSDQMTD